MMGIGLSMSSCRAQCMGALLLFTMLGGLAPAAHGQNAPAGPEPPDPRMVGFGEIYKAAEDLRKAGRHEEAVLLFEHAYRMLETPFVKFDIARECLALGRLEDGLAALELYERNTAEPRDEGRRQPDIDRLRKELRARRAFLRITVDKPGTQVMMDGRPLTAQDLGRPVPVLAGKPYRVTGLRGPAVTQEGTAGPRAEVQVTLTMRRPPLSILPSPALSVGKWVLAGAGLAGLVLGGTLGLLDGYRSCPTAPMCAQELTTGPASITLLSVGGAAMVGAVAMFYLDHRRSERLLRAAAEER